MNVTLYHSRDFANVLKHLDMWNYPALAGWVQCNHKGPYKKETEDQIQKKKME